MNAGVSLEQWVSGRRRPAPARLRIWLAAFCLFLAVQGLPGPSRLAATGLNLLERAGISLGGDKEAPQARSPSSSAETPHVQKPAAKGRLPPEPLPEEVANAVSSTAAESLLMGMFVLICSFELRGVKAGVSERPGYGPSPSGPLQDSQGSSNALVSFKGSSSVLGGAQLKQSVAASDDDIGSIYGMDDYGQDMLRQNSAEQAIIRNEREKWQIAPLVLMMVLLHVIYPSFPISPQVELGRIMTFLGFLWSVGPHRCIAVVNTEPVRTSCRLIWMAMVGAVVYAVIFVIADTISDLIFPLASSAHDLFAGPRYLHQLLLYLTVRYPVREDSFCSWTAWCVVSAVVFSSAVWKEFLFRGVYLGGLRTRMPFWAANMTTALIYALAHEPIYLSPDGSVTLQLVGCAPLLIGAMWYGYLYQSCNNLIVTVLAHLLFNAVLLGLHLWWC